MSLIKPPGNKGKKPAYGSVPVKKTNQPIARSSGKPTGKQVASKYSAPKKKKLPTPVIVTNILMIGVILAICGVVFAIAYNNIQYDKADAARSSKPSVGATSSGVTNSQNVTSSVNSQVSSVQNSSAAETSVPSVNTGEFDVEFFKDDLFIGDSIFTGLYLYSYLDQKNVAASVGYTAYGAQVNPFDEAFYPGSATAYAKDKQPKRIIIMLGSNSLSPLAAADNYEDFITGYRGLLNTLKRDCSESTICVVSVPPITADSSIASYSGVTNTIIDNANAKLKSLCADLGLMYYDLNSVLKDANGYFNEEYAADDGMHFLGSTYPIFLSGVQNLLG